MGEPWKPCKLGELGEFRNGVNFNMSQEGEGLPVIKVKDFGDLTTAPMSGYDELDSKAIKIPPNQYVKEGDTLIIRSNGNPGLVGRSMLFRGAPKPTTFSGFCIRFRPDSTKVVPAFAAYFIRSPLCRQHFTAYGTGTGIQNLSQDILSNLVVPLPPLPTQRAIAGVLGALDDKIEVNRRMARTLEAAARALFESWFVRFEPPGNNTPAPRLVDSPLGPIPEGWTVRPLDTVARFLNGLALQKFPPKDGEPTLPVIKIAQLRKGDTVGADRANTEIAADYVVSDGDMLFSWSGSLECVLWTGGPGALNQHLFKVTSTEFPQWFVYLWVQQHLPEFRHIAAAKATTMGHIQRHHLTNALVAVPPAKVLAEMGRTLGPMTEAIPYRMIEARTLAAMRDSLLPRVISGELEIPAAMLEEAAR